LSVAERGTPCGPAIIKRPTSFGY